MDTEGALEGVLINGVFVLSRMNLDPVYMEWGTPV